MTIPAACGYTCSTCGYTCSMWLYLQHVAIPAVWRTASICSRCVLDSGCQTKTCKRNDSSQHVSYPPHVTNNHSSTLYTYTTSPPERFPPALSSPTFTVHVHVQLYHIQSEVTYPKMLGPEGIRITEMFGLTETVRRVSCSASAELLTCCCHRV